MFPPAGAIVQHYIRGKSIVRVHGDKALKVYCAIVNKLTMTWLMYKEQTMDRLMLFKNKISPSLLTRMESNAEGCANILRCHFVELFIQEVFVMLPCTLAGNRCIFSQVMHYYGKLKLTRNMKAKSYLSIKAVRAELESSAREKEHTDRSSRNHSLIHMR